MARLVANAFEQEGFDVWWDAALHSGETFDEVIEKELRAARAVVVLWSPRSVASRWVRAEATLADRNKTLAPAIIEPCDRPIIFELTHTVDLSGWDGDTKANVWQSYVKDIHRLVSDGKAAEKSKSSAAKPSPEPHRPHPATAAGKAAKKAKEEADAKPAGGADMESLISAISTLQEALQKTGGQAPASPPPVPEPEVEAEPEAEADDSEATQFFTASDNFAMLEGEEFHCLELSVVGEEEVQERFIVGPLGVKIGRTKPADIVLADGKISRSHCQVELNDDLLFVTDLNSTNGTFVDGQKVTGAATLPLGSTLRVGHFALVHEMRKREEL